MSGKGVVPYASLGLGAASAIPGGACAGRLDRATDYPFAVLPDATRERSRLFLARGGVAPSPPPADLDADRVLRLRAALSPDFEPASFETDTAGVAAEMTAALDFRPKPSALAIVERRSE